MFLRGILSAAILLFSEGLLLKGSRGPLVAELGGILRLPCAVETALPLDELEVKWRRTDPEALVHLFQGGESRPESQSDLYKDRAQFFTEREIAKGNYSLLLHNVTTDDAGSYSCSVYAKGETGDIAVEIKAIERLVLTGANHAVTANVGDEVILNCFVDSHIPPEEVSWTKVNADKSRMLVLLFQDNETYPDSAHASYQGRTDFFTSEIPKGNFSLRLKDVRTEDKGEYICEAHSGHLSANTTAMLQGLGLSSMHILVLTLCCSAFILALVLSAVILLGIKDISQRALRMHYVLVFGPNVLMFTAFVLWGIIEGFLGEVVTCSTLNLIRFILLFKACLYQEKLPEMIKTIMTTGFRLEYLIIFSTVYYVIFYSVWSSEGESKTMAFMSIMYGSSLHMAIQSFFGGGAFLEIMDLFYLFSVSFLSRTFSESAFISMFAGFFVIPLSLRIFDFIIDKRYSYLINSDLYCLGYLAYFLMRRLIISVIVFYFFYQILENNEERAGLLSVTALLHLLALAAVVDSLKLSLAETPKMILYMYGAVGVLAVNAATLATELILKSRKGERTIADLRVAVVPFECVFVLGWIVLWAHAYWRDDNEGIKTEIAICKRDGCRHWIKGLKGDSDPPEDYEMTERSQSSSAGSTSPAPAPPPEAQADIHVPEDAEDTNACSSEPVNEGGSNAAKTAAELVDPLHSNADTERHLGGSPVEEMHTSPLLKDKDIISSTDSHKPATENTDPLLSHGQREPEADSKEPGCSTASEHMECSPLLEKDAV